MIQSALPLRGRLGVFVCLWLAALVALAGCTLPSSDDQSVDQGVVSGPPVVEIASPRPNATYLEGVSVNIQASIANAGPDIARVEIAVDGAIVATYPQPNPSGVQVFSVTQAWPITSPGQHTISVTAFRADGTSSAPATINISVVSQAEQQPTPTSAQAQPTTAASPQSQPAAADTGSTTQPQAQPTSPPATDTPPPPPPTSSKPMVRLTVGVNVRSGPGIIFNPPIGSLAANSEAEILGKNPAGDWYKIRYWNGEGWVFGANVVVSGDTSNIPIDPGPPTPAPTPVPPTAAPTTPPLQVNLIVESLVVDPHPLVCGKASSIKVTVKNIGSEAASSGGAIVVEDIRVSDNTRTEKTEGVFPALGPGASHTAEMFLTVSSNYDELHRIVARIDSNNQVPESNEGDNTGQTDHQLQKGSCP